MVQHVSDNLKLDVVVCGSHQTVCNKIRSLLLTPSKQRHLVFAGYAFQGSGDWVLQDDSLSFATFASIFKEAEVENVLRQQEGSTLSLYIFPEGEWSSNSFAKHPVSKFLKISVNPEEKLSELAGVVQFGGYLSYLVKVHSVMELHKASDVVGNIRFSRPTLYIFPGCQGDSSLFGISGFNLLVNGGYSRKACFWDFTRHLDRIDAVLLTHLGADNLFGISSVLQRKALENAHPEIGHMYFNCLDKQLKHSPNGDGHPENGGAHKSASLLINLVEEGNGIIENLRNLGQSPHPCTGNVVSHALQPLNLYHKVGHGTLDMYVLNPLQDSKELKDFVAQWGKHVSNFSTTKSQFKVNNKEMSIPIANMMSIAALLVWRPAAANEAITRILFPGTTPQNRLFEGLDKLKNLDIFQHPCCSESSLHAPKGQKKAPGAKGRGAAPKSTPPPMAPSPVKIEPKRDAAKSGKGTSPAKPTKEAKNIKKVASGKDEKSPATTPSDTKSPTPAESPRIITTPTNTPAEVSSPDKSETLSSDVASSHEAVTPLKEEVAPPVEQPAAPEPEEPVLLIPEPAAPAQVQQDVPEPLEAWPEASAQQALPESQQDITPTDPSPGEMPVGLGDPLIPGFGGDQAPPSINLMDTTPEADRPPPPAEAQFGQPMESPEALPEPAATMDQFAAPESGIDLLQETKQPDIIADTEQPEKSFNQQQMEELGIYDGDEKDVDTTEVGQEPAVPVSQPTLAELGIYDEQEPPQETKQPEQPECEQDQLPQSPSDVPEAEVPSEVPSEANKALDGAMPAESDSGVFDGAAPEGLPSPQEPELEISTPVVVPDVVEKTDEPTMESPPDAECESEPEKTQIPVEESLGEPANAGAAEQEALRPEMFPDVSSESLSPFNADDQECSKPEVSADDQVSTPEVPLQVSETAACETTEESQEAELGLESLQPLQPDDLEPVSSPAETDLHQPQDTTTVTDPLSTSSTETEPIGTETESALESDLTPPAPCDQLPLTPTDDNQAGADVEHSPFEIIDAPKDLSPEDGAAPVSTNPFIIGTAEDDVPQSSEFGVYGEPENIPSHNGPLADAATAPNPFEIPQQPAIPAFAREEEQDRDSLEREGEAPEGEFDPLQSWGQPIGLPAPSPRKGDKPGAEGATAKDPKAATSKNGPSKARPSAGGAGAGARKAPAASTKKPAAATGAAASAATAKPRSAPAKKDAPPKREATKKEEPKKNGAKDAAPKRAAPGGPRKTATRPTTAPIKQEPAGRTGAKRPATTASTKSAPAAKPLAPVIPCYLDLTYIPSHGDMSYIDMDFFRRVRAKYYVLSALCPSPQVLNALLEAKETWDNPDLEVTIIPTHDTPTLHHWMGLHRDQLSQNKIVVAPSANRCTIQLQDQEASCSAYRLEF